MLIPLTRKKFEQIIPLMATGPQYTFYWGKFPDFLKRLLISVVGIVVLLLLRSFLGEDSEGILFLIGIFIGLYWLWGPVLWASIRNAGNRKLPYSGFWRGQVLDIYITEELIGEEETVNKKGQLVIVETRERRLNIEVGDETGFTTQLQVPLRREHKAIAPGLIAEMLVMSYRGDLSSIVKTSDIYIPDRNLWVSDYPYLRRDLFAEVSRQLEYPDDEREYRSERPTRTKPKRR